MQCFDIAKFGLEWQTGGRLNAKLAMRRILLRGIEFVANILGVVKNCRPLANASNCKVWEECISEDFHTTCKLVRMTLRAMPMLVRFYIAIEDGSAQLKRELGEPHTKGGIRATRTAQGNIFWRTVFGARFGIYRTSQVGERRGFTKGHRERGLGKEGRERLVNAKTVDQFRVHPAREAEMDCTPSWSGHWRP